MKEKVAILGEFFGLEKSGDLLRLILISHLIVISHKNENRVFSQPTDD
jgi:hypothetical protein